MKYRLGARRNKILVSESSWRKHESIFLRQGSLNNSLPYNSNYMILGKYKAMGQKMH